MKRPARAKPEALAEQSIIVADKIINPVALTLEATRDLCNFHRPKQEQFAGMIQCVLDRKRWSAGQYAALIGAKPFDIWRILHAKYNPDETLGRLIWIIYTLDTNPSVLFDPFKLATWGLSYAKLPQRHDKEREEIEDLMKEESYLTVREIAEELAQRGTCAEYRVIRHVAKRIGYRLKDGHKGCSKPVLLRPHSIWMHLDWSKSNADLAEAIGMSPSRVKEIRCKLKKVRAKDLLNAFLAAGREPKAMEALYRNYHLNAT